MLCQNHLIYNVQARELMENNQLEDAVHLSQQSIVLKPHCKFLELLGECFVLLVRLPEAVVPLSGSHDLESRRAGTRFTGRCFSEA